nr:TolC family protein [Bacteriovorax sp. HI3]
MFKTLFFFTSLFTLTAAEARPYQLKELIEKAKVHPEVKIEQFEVDKANVLFDRIDGEFRPRLSLVSGIGPNKSVTGTPLASQQSSRIDTYTYMAEIQLKIPLYAFNREKDMHEAAQGNLKVKELEVQKKQATLIKKVKEYFYGYQYAASLNDFAGSTLKDLDEVIADMKDNKKAKNEDLTKLVLFRSLAQVKKYEIEKGLAQALLGLKFISQDDNPTVEQDWIEFNQREVPTLESINKNLGNTNIDLQRANLGVDAKTKFLTGEKKSQLPVIGLFSSFDWKNTPHSTEQSSKFAYDPYNKSDFSIGIGLIWDIDFGIKSSNISNARIELETVKAQQNFAIKNLPIQMEKIYLDLMEAQKKASELEQSYKTSKKLLNNIASGVALGITPAKDIIESYTLKAQVYQQFVEAVYNYELKLAELSYEAGAEFDPALK